jgi:hypothetical protein
MFYRNTAFIRQKSHFAERKINNLEPITALRYCVLSVYPRHPLYLPKHQRRSIVYDELAH